MIKKKPYQTNKQTCPSQGLNAVQRTESSSIGCHKGSKLQEGHAGMFLYLKELPCRRGFVCVVSSSVILSEDIGGSKGK